MFYDIVIKTISDISDDECELRSGTSPDEGIGELDIKGKSKMEIIDLFTNK